MMARKLTLKEVAALLRRSPKTIYTWTSERKIPFIKIGGIVLFDEEELEKWMKEFRVVPHVQRRRP
ncbi:MAG: helix-turn-helix domain-containing protein [Elusimicrobiota bacterium]